MPFGKLSFITVLLAIAVAASAKTPAPEPAAAKFVTQTLSPTGGSIKRPKEWFYNEYHKEPVYTWLISVEDPSQEEATTAVCIQTIAGVKAKAGKSPKQFAIDFLAARKKEAVKVIKTDVEKKAGAFTVVRMETEEGDHHALYSVFWGNGDLDVVVISTAGTSTKLWDTYAATFRAMSDFELIDLKWYEKSTPLPLTAARLAGHWRYTDPANKVSNDYTFNGDGTFAGSIEQDGKVTWKTAGKWTLEGDTVNYKLTSSSSEQFPGGVDQDKIVEITKDYYVVDAGNGDKRKYERVK